MRTPPLLIAAVLSACAGGKANQVESERPVELAIMDEVLGSPLTNSGACKRYVEAFNTAPCTPVTLPLDELCPPVLDMSPCDLAPYYECMAAAVKCNGEFLDLTGQAACSMPSCP